jgi:hypothetical protein
MTSVGDALPTDSANRRSESVERLTFDGLSVGLYSNHGRSNSLSFESGQGACCCIAECIGTVVHNDFMAPIPSCKRANSR